MIHYGSAPVVLTAARKGADIHFSILGDKNLQCRLMLIKTTESKLPEFSVKIKGSKDALKGKKVENGNLEFRVPGDQQISIRWKKNSR
jgi:hypothetical protein